MTFDSCLYFQLVTLLKAVRATVDGLKLVLRGILTNNQEIGAVVGEAVWNNHCEGDLSINYDLVANRADMFGKCSSFCKLGFPRINLDLFDCCMFLSIWSKDCLNFCCCVDVDICQVAKVMGSNLLQRLTLVFAKGHNASLQLVNVDL